MNEWRQRFERFGPGIGLFVVLAFVALLYAPTLQFQFVYDDVFQIALNPHVHSWHYFPIYFTQNVWSHVPNNTAGFYRPLFLLWLRVNNVMFADEPAGWHLTTLLVHLLATFLVYLLGRELLKNRNTALLSAAIFGVHPIHLEAAAWVSGVNESLAGVLFLSAFLGYLQWKKSSGKKQWLPASLGFYTAALLVKETAAALVLVIAAYEYFCRTSENSEWAERRPAQFRVLAWYGGVLLMYCFARSFAVHGFANHATASIRTSLLSWPWLLCLYLKMLVWPARLSPLYDFSYVMAGLDFRLILPGMAAIVLVLALIRCSRRHSSKVALFLFTWFAITLAPAFVQFLLARSSESYHDRYLYLPSVAFALLVGELFDRTAQQAGPIRRPVVWTCSAVVLVLLAVSARSQMGVWENNYSLFAHAHEVAPGNELAASNLAAELINRGKYLEARALSLDMIRLHPGTLPPLGTAASASFLLHDYAAAEQYYSSAIELDPKQSHYFYMLGLAEVRLGKYNQAIANLHEAIRLSPDEPFLHYALGNAFAEQQDWAGAQEEFLAELRLNSDGSQLPAKQALQNAQTHLQAKIRLASSNPSSDPR